MAKQPNPMKGKEPKRKPVMPDDPPVEVVHEYQRSQGREPKPKKEKCPTFRAPKGA